MVVENRSREEHLEPADLEMRADLDQQPADLEKEWVQVVFG